ncbi:Sec2p-domain-containing protein, partial [Myriangium duriaei CBS 260.36]
DLSGEVAMLSTKLINAINHSTSLDDSLQQVHIELKAARHRIEELERDKASHTKDVADGVLLKKVEVDSNIQQLRSELDQARREREASDKAKKQMEIELESLTASLFEQANTMVADARRENEAAEKRNAQLRAQLADTEVLLASQQEQLQDLKTVMEKMSSERDETETATHLSTAPSTPATDSNKMSRMLESFPLSPGMNAEVQPDHPLRFSHLLTPVIRTDLQSYNDFADLLKTSRAINQITHNRSSSGNIAFNRSPTAVSSNPAASSSSPHLPGSFHTPSTPSMSSPRDAQSSPLPPLKDSKFFKRCLTEDIEPTLRLDLAPGLSWLARRTVLTSITAGALVIEPFASTSKLYGPVYACALCGEDRRQEIYARRHRFRTSEDPSAQRHPLCEYCLNRLRATCDFAAFLRMCRDGTWKAANDEEIKAGWDEAVRLRERMFWSRIGGGVVP